MSNQELLLELKHRRPFEPFKVHMVDGSTYEVPDYRLFVVMEDRIFLATPDRRRWSFLHFQNIANIESPIAA